MDLELHFPLPKKKLPLGEMLAGSRRWLQLSEPQHQNGRVCFHPGLFAFQSPLIAFKCFIARTPNAEEHSESSAAKMLWCAWEQPPPPAPAPAAPSCWQKGCGWLQGGMPLLEIRDIFFAPSGKEGPAALPCSSSPLPRRKSSFPLPVPQAPFYLLICFPDLPLHFTLPLQPITPAELQSSKGPDSDPSNSCLPLLSPRNLCQETNINSAPAPLWGRCLGTEKQLLFLGVCAVTFRYLRFSERVLQPFSAQEALRGVGKLSRGEGEERQHFPTVTGIMTPWLLATALNLPLKKRL